MNKSFLCVCLCLCATSVTAKNTCVKEQERADYWNDQLRHKSTEYRRERHRQAKSEFLSCLRKPKQTDQAPTQPQYRPTKPNKVVNKPQAPNSMSVEMTSYSNFKGKKKRAWESYFKESQVCAQNSDDMSVFVQCAKERKHFLKMFNRRWDEVAQKLRPSLDQN